MSFDPDAVETIAFDSDGTIVDVTGVEASLSKYVDDPGTIAKLWLDRSLTYAMVANAIEEYDSFYQMNRHALRYALETVDVDPDEDDREEILSTYHELPVFDDVRDGMKRLDEAGYDCYVVPNGNEEMLVHDGAGVARRPHRGHDQRRRGRAVQTGSRPVPPRPQADRQPRRAGRLRGSRLVGRVRSTSACRASGSTDRTRSGGRTIRSPR